MLHKNFTKIRNCDTIFMVLIAVVKYDRRIMYYTCIIEVLNYKYRRRIYNSEHVYDS